MFIKAVILFRLLMPLLGSASAQVIYQDLPLVPTYAKAHGIVMGITFVLIFPAGAIFVRTSKMKHTMWIHVACQVLGTGLMLAGLASGIRVGKILDRLHNNAHTILGTVVVVGLLFQPIIGFIHHRRFIATQKRSGWTHTHIWYGRLLVALGIINGGLGLLLASNTRVGEIVYGVLAGVIGLAYAALVMMRRKPKGEVHQG